ncbi:MAG TPA: GGDEF domain-containing protein [Thermoanaerobaculia bacterium]|nr:GGDEF domain-containing protein [Thermoanaerobaculia bacterium]
MRDLDPQILRAIQSVSELLGRRLELTTAGAEDNGGIVSRTEHGELLSIRTIDGRGYSAHERRFLGELLGLIQKSLIADEEQEALDNRLRALERENVDLTMKNRALAEASSRDALTGLYNRWYVLQKIEEELNRSWRHGSPLSLLMIDLDHFKQINDSYGHPAGDQVLQAIGHVLRDSCRIYDIPGRYGGEEFCLMLPETPVNNTMPVAERIRRRVEMTSFNCADLSVRITTSIGVAGLESVPDEALFGASSLIERADRALYTAKDRGRNRIELWTPSLVSRSFAVAEH